MPYLDENGNLIGASGQATPPPVHTGRATYLDDSGQPQSVADIARKRLAAQGLTPQQVKGGQGVTTPDQVHFADPSQEHGGFLSGVGNAINPLNWVHLDPVTKTVVAMLHRNPDELPGMQAIHAAKARGQQPGALDVASAGLQEAGLPDVIGTAQESYHRGAANQSRADMYGGVAGSAVVAALAKGAESIPENAGAATYAKVFGKNADAGEVAQVVPRLLQERKIVASPEALSKHGSNIAANAGVDEAIANMPNPVDLQSLIKRVDDLAKKGYINEVEMPDGSTKLVPNGPDAEAILKQIDQYKGNLRENASPRPLTQDGELALANQAGDAQAMATPRSMPAHLDQIVRSMQQGRAMLDGNPSAPLSESVGSQMPEAITPQNARTLRQNYDTIFDKRNPMATVTDKAKSVVGTALRGELNTDPNVAAANAEAHYGYTLRDLADKTPPQPGGGVAGAMTGAATGYLWHKFIGGWVVPGMSEVYAAYKIGKAVVQSPLYRTTMGVVKNQLAKAATAGDGQAAMAIAAKVAGGDGLNDEYGHDQAVHSVVDNAFAQADGNPHVARQYLHGQEAVYENPDGSTVPVPGHVTRAFVNGIGTNLQHADTGVAPSNAQGGQNQAGGQPNLRQAGPVNPSRSFESDKGRGDASEFARVTGHGQIQHENSDLVNRVPPDQLLPKSFATARKASGASAIDGLINLKRPGLQGLYGEPLGYDTGPGANVLAESDRTGAIVRAEDAKPHNTILTSKDGSNDPFVVLHEYGHAGFEHDLTPAQRDQMRALYSKYTKPARDLRAASDAVWMQANQGQYRQPDPAAEAKIAALDAKAAQMEQRVPQAFRNLNPTEAQHYGFPSLLSSYVLDPSAFRQKYPDLYGFVKSVYGGLEFIRK